MSHDGTFFKGLYFIDLAGRIHDFLTIGAQSAAFGGLCCALLRDAKTPSGLSDLVSAPRLRGLGRGSTGTVKAFCPTSLCPAHQVRAHANILCVEKAGDHFQVAGESLAVGFRHGPSLRNQHPAPARPFRHVAVFRQSIGQRDNAFSIIDVHRWLKIKRLEDACENVEQSGTG